MNRRSALLSLLAGMALPQAALAQAGSLHPLAPVWALWKEASITPEGRVVDGPQQDTSHSESQSYGLLLAALMADAEAFDRIDRWTMANLAVRPDRLLAWRWLPDAVTPVPDRNNASDGDLFYAWALIRGARTLSRPDLIDRATGIATDLARTSILPHPADPARVIFTPAAEGFARPDGVVINPSYYMPLAMREIAEATGVTAFAAAARDGLALLSDLAASGLMPDWITVGAAGYAPDPQMSDRNGYDALRVPLFLIWSGHADHPAVARQAQALAGAGHVPPDAPTVFDRTSLALQETSADPGYAAVAGLVTCAADGQTGGAIPRFDPAQPYYPATLHLFALFAQIEAVPSCVPI